ncbi:MAG: succinoglycan biosynthesis protein ExoW [bacterium]|jgi:succinoglycan biosynthesis protein ExoW
MQVNKSLGVIVPYYQTSSGVLSKAIVSISNQVFTGPINVYIVDDGSPIPANKELENISIPENILLNIVVQENQGPSAARNKALSLAKNDNCEYVAFLDSDDEWTPQHLDNAVFALELGNDFYFSNYMQLDATEAVFTKAGISLENHTLIDHSRSIYQYSGDMIDQVLTNPIVNTSTVVYNQSKMEHLQFDEAFLKAREDHLLWLDIAALNAKFCFSVNVEQYCGRGVNIWASTKWGSDNVLPFLFYDIKFSKRVLKKYPLNNAQKLFLTKKISKLRYSIFLDLAHRLGHNKKINIGMLMKIFKLDFKALLFTPFFALKYAFSKR